jgi:hypothetical protein
MASYLLKNTLDAKDSDEPLKLKVVQSITLLLVSIPIQKNSVLNVNTAETSNLIKKRALVL